MSKIKHEKAYAKKKISSFGGIREGICKNGENALDIRNLRIRPDGSLEKRSGWRSWRYFTTPVRGFWQGTVEESHYIFTVAGNTVYRIIEGSNVLNIGQIRSSIGTVHFFRYRNRLYLLDGVTVYVFSPKSTSFAPARGYVPLYGHNWHPTQLGDTNEPVNLLNQNLRIHYLNTAGTKTFSLPYFADSLDSVRVNNRVVTDYSFTKGSDSFTLSAASAGDTVEISMTISGTDPLSQQLRSARNSFLYRDGSQESLLLYGASQGYRVFSSSEVSDFMLTYCSIFYSDCDPLYFRYNQTLSIGDDDHPVTAMTSSYDRILAFYPGGAHSISFQNGKIFSYPVLFDTGCSSSGAAVQIGNDSVVINERGVCRLHATASDPDTLSVQNLSECLGEKWSRELCKTASLFWDSTRQELWVRNYSEQEEGIVWIWNASLDKWYCFDQIHANFFSVYNGQLLFGANNRLCYFEENNYADEGVPFDAYYQSDYLSFDSPHAAKRSLRASVCATPGEDSDLLLTLETERTAHTVTFHGKSDSVPAFFDLRISPGRFRFLRYRISCTGKSASKIYEANFFTTL